MTTIHVSEKRNRTWQKFYSIYVFRSWDKLVAAVCQTPNWSHFQSADCCVQVPARSLWLRAFLSAVCISCTDRKCDNEEKNSYHYERHADARPHSPHSSLGCPTSPPNFSSCSFPPLFSLLLPLQTGCLCLYGAAWSRTAQSWWSDSRAVELPSSPRQRCGRLSGI